MTTSSTHRPAHISGATTRVAAYWISTAILGAECLGGGVMGALRLPPFIDTATHLGYPAYFMTILGVWYVLAGIVVLAPRLPLLKEWAYAGLIFNYTGAAFSHVWMGDSLEKLVGPVIFIGLTLTSWELRPQSRRAFTPSPLPTVGFRVSASLPIGSRRCLSPPNLPSVVCGTYYGLTSSATWSNTSATRRTS